MSERMLRYLSQDQMQNNNGIAVHNRVIRETTPLHWHNYLELELILEGDGVQTLNGEEQVLQKGCFSVIRLTDYHQVTPGEKLRLLNLMVDDKLLTEEMLARLTEPQLLFYKLSEHEASTMESLMNLCMTEQNLPDADRVYLRHLITCIFLRIFKQTPVIPAGKRSAGKGIQASLLYLHMHFRENPKLQEAANIAHYNASHFSTTFHKEMGMTYNEYLNLLKLSYAKELLLSTDLKIREIGYECGFTSHSNFLRLFKEKVGMAPIQFRRR